MGATRWHEEQCQKEEKTMIDNFNDEQTIVLSEYEIANLRSLLEACGYPNGQCPKNPFYAANTGDWLGQIYNKLPKINLRPNRTPNELAEDSTLLAKYLEKH